MSALGNNSFRAFLLGTCGVFALTIGSSQSFAAVCGGVVSATLDNGGNVEVFTSDCVVTQAEQPVVSTGTATATDIQLLSAGANISHLKIDAGAAIVNAGDNGTSGYAIRASGVSIAKITNDGFIASQAYGSAGTISVFRDANFTLHNGTESGSTEDSALIFTFQTPTTSSPSSTVSVYGSLQNQSFAEVSIIQGSEQSAGAIIHADEDEGQAIVVAGAFNGVDIQNRQGSIQGGSAITVYTPGPVSIINGIDADSTGSIISQAERGTSIFVDKGFVDPHQFQLEPSIVSIVNNVGSEILAEGFLSYAVAIGDVDGGTIHNYGTIASEEGWAYFRSGATGNKVVITNEGQMTGNIFLGNNDELIMSGGVITGSVAAFTDQGLVIIDADARLNGSIISTTGVTYDPITGAPDPTSIDIDFNFGLVSFRNDSTLTVGEYPRYDHLNDGIPFSLVSSTIETETDGTGALNILYLSYFTQSIGTSSAGLREVNFLSELSQLKTGTEYYVAETSVGSGAELYLPLDQTISGNLTIYGGLYLNDTELTLAQGPIGTQGDFTTASTSMLYTLVTADGVVGEVSGGASNDLGQIFVNGNAFIADGTTITAEIDQGVTISSGATYLFIDGNEASSETILGNAVLTESDGMIWGVYRGDSALIEGSDSVYDIFLVADPGSLATELVNELTGDTGEGLGEVLGELASDTTTTEALELFTNLTSLPTSEEIQVALTQLAPSTSGGAIQGSSAAIDAATSAVTARSDIVASALFGGETGMSAGDEYSEIGIWMQPYGFSAAQDERKGFDGYGADGYGFAFGVDKKLSPDFAFGGALSYGYTKVDGKGILSANQTEVDNYQAALYGVYSTSEWIAQVQVAYAVQVFDSVRQVTVGAISERPTANYDGSAFSSIAMLGRLVHAGDFTFTPTATIAYSFSQQDSYTEENAPTTALSVEEGDAESLKTALGLRVQYVRETVSGDIWKPEMRLGWQYEHLADAPESIAKFAFGSSSFTSSGAQPAKSSALVGAGLTYTTADGFSLSGQYNAEIKDAYLSNTATLMLRWEF